MAECMDAEESSQSPREEVGVIIKNIYLYYKL